MSGKNQELEQLLNKMKQDGTKESMEQMMNCLQQCDLFLPAVLPKNTDPKLMKALAESKSQKQPIPKGIVPQPALLENKEGKRFLPIFSSEEQITKGPQRYPLTLGMPFQSCMDFIAKQKGITGIVINAFDQNIILNTNVQKEPQQQEVRLTKEQLHAVVRQKLEADVLPSLIFEKKAALVEELKEDAGKVLVELYTELYPDQVPCPYDEDEFELMALNIRDDLTVIRLTLPEKHLVPGTCPMLLLAWNPIQETIRYCGIVKGKEGTPSHIMEALQDGSKKDLGEAPADGSELQYMIDLNTTD